MTSKMISIRDDVYKKLKRLKNSNESFSDLIEKLISNQQKNPLKHFGIAKNLSNDVIQEFNRAIIDGKEQNIIQSSKKFSELWED
jgi:predicted CopG family antitoxin